MRTTSLVTSAAALALIAAPLAAQQTKAIPVSSATRIVASYDFWNAPRDAAFPRSVTVSDSAGTIVARVDLGNSEASVPMTVTVIERNLVLQGQTSEGLLTLVLDRQNEGGETKLTSGTWTLGKAQGQLRGRVQP
ncbi:MAG: hypothetical protein H7099_07880 [Gemmatimonadaceae bacterium]|nr:hypothetical protein [Gemmatimonadaceae bacterium]